MDAPVGAEGVHQLHEEQGLGVRHLRWLDETFFHCLLAGLELIFITCNTLGDSDFLYQAASFAIDPDICIASDVCQAWTPDCKPTDYISKLGEGPRMPIGANVAPFVSNSLKKKAGELRMPVQITVSPSRTGTDAWAVQTQREGIATAVLSLPLRYMHTPQEVIDLKDLEQLAELMAAFAQDPGEEVRTCLNI